MPVILTSHCWTPTCCSYAWTDCKGTSRTTRTLRLTQPVIHIYRTAHSNSALLLSACTAFLLVSCSVSQQRITLHKRPNLNDQCNV